MERRATVGVPQGSCTSPLTFGCAVESILHLFDHKAAGAVAATNVLDISDDPHPGIAVETNCFADDTAFLVRGKCLADLQEKMQWVLDKSTIWAKSKGLNFSSAKTNVIIFLGILFPHNN